MSLPLKMYRNTSKSQLHCRWGCLHQLAVQGRQRGGSCMPRLQEKEVKNDPLEATVSKDILGTLLSFAGDLSWASIAQCLLMDRSPI